VALALVAGSGLGLTGCGRAAVAASPRRLALLIGVNKYQDPAIPRLAGSENDVRNWADVLTRRFGFAAGDVRTLIDEQATKAAVKDAFKRHLVAQATADTVVVVAISSHGTQVFDESGDEKTDGLDESFVLYDSHLNNGQGPHNQLIDDEVNELITQLNAKTKHVVFIADSCFSGTVTRAAGVTRALPPTDRDKQLAAQRVGTSRGFVADAPETIKPEGGGARYVLISAASSTEEAHERQVGERSHGALTWFLTAALRHADADASYHDVFETVRQDVTAAFPSQHPQIEGAEQEGALFGLRPVRAEPYLAVEMVQGRMLTLAGGEVHGIGVGSKFGIFAPGTKSPKGATPLASATVKAVDLASARAEMPGEVNVPRGARAFPTEFMVPLHFTRVFVPKTPALLARVREAVASNPALRLIDEDKGYDLRVSYDPAKQLVQLEGGTAEPIADPIFEGPDAARAVAAQISLWARWTNLLHLRNQPEDLRVSFKLLRAAGFANATAAASDGDLTRLIVGEGFDLEIRNLSDQTLYFNVLDLSSTGAITVAYPPLGGEAVLKPRDTWRQHFTATLRDDVDYDRDHAKLVVSTRPLDLRFVQQDGPARSRAAGAGVTGVLETLFARTAFGANSRGFQMQSQVADQWATRELAFEVQPRVSEQEKQAITSCYDGLKAAGLQWKKTRPMRGVADPVELEPQINGVTFRSYSGKIGKLYMSCLFAEKLARFAREAARLGVTEIKHKGIYNYRCIGNGSPDIRACKVSQHAYGRAIDFDSFTVGKDTYVVRSDWNKRPPPTCDAKGGSAKDQFLRQIACKTSQAAGFSVLLTPNYNAAHRDHFHADATPSNHVFVRGARGGERNGPETDPADAALGD
jgi:hypothetical protein